MTLTETDKADIRQRAFSFQKPDDLIREATFKVARFCGTNDYVQWAGRVLDALCEYRLYLYGNEGRVTYSGVETLLDLKARWAGLVQNAWESHKEDLESEDLAPEDHPWGENTIAICNWWLEQSPYTVFRLAENMDEWACDSVREGLFSLLLGDGGQEVAQTIEKRWDEEIFSILERFEVESWGAEAA